MLRMIHMALPKMLQPDGDEARAMAEAQLRLQGEFGFVMSTKAEAIMALIAVHFAVYQGKFAALAEHRRAMARAAQMRRQSPQDHVPPPGWAPSTDTTGPAPRPGPETARMGDIVLPYGPPLDGGRIDLGGASG